MKFECYFQVNRIKFQNFGWQLMPANTKCQQILPLPDPFRPSQTLTPPHRPFQALTNPYSPHRPFQTLTGHYSPSQTALLILFTAAAGTGIVPPHLLPLSNYRSFFSSHVFTAGLSLISNGINGFILFRL